MSQPSELEPAEQQLQKLRDCEECIGYLFQNKALLRGALTHASGADHRLSSNERLEFLGDAILGWVVCEMLYHRFPDYLEGDLTRVKSTVVSRQTCARVSSRLGLERFLILGKGMAATPRLPDSLLADVFESLIAAMYLDGGEGPAVVFIQREMEPEITEAAHGRGSENYKSLLQQLAQREFGNTPVYQLLDERGPDHSKCFKVAAVVGKTQFPAAWGRNKKEAEQRAACNALSELNDEIAPWSGTSLENDVRGRELGERSASRKLNVETRSSTSGSGRGEDEVVGRAETCDGSRDASGEKTLGTEGQESLEGGSLKGDDSSSMSL